MMFVYHRRSITEKLSKKVVPKSKLDPAYMKLLHVVKQVAESRGHQIKLISVDAHELTELAWVLIQHAYYHRARTILKRCDWHRIPKFDRSQYKYKPVFPVYVADGFTKLEYIIGWHFVPNYMLSLRPHLHPVSALDSSFMKQFAQGTFTAEVTTDGLRRLHAVGLQVLISPENIPLYKRYFKFTKEAYDHGVIDPPGAVVVADGAHALRGELDIARPNTTYLPCLEHLVRQKPSSVKALVRALAPQSAERATQVCQTSLPPQLHLSCTHASPFA
jgi:hypothetical protein